MVLTFFDVIDSSLCEKVNNVSVVHLVFFAMINDLVVVEVLSMPSYECDSFVKPGNGDSRLTKMVFAHHGGVIASTLKDNQL
jgi:hypothetical protein